MSNDKQEASTPLTSNGERSPPKEPAMEGFFVPAQQEDPVHELSQSSQTDDQNDSLQALDDASRREAEARDEIELPGGEAGDRRGGPLSIRKEMGTPSVAIRKTQKFQERRQERLRVLNPFAASGNTTPVQKRPRGEQAELVASTDQEASEIFPSQDSATPELQQQDDQRSESVRHRPGDASLTHVKSSGEAHMVDVSSKPATKRVAIAFAYVRCSNSQSFPLIAENNNKKGDVLGVARVAGIMATKRTSDLIPLCHPIAITKVEVDLKLIPPKTNSSVVRDNRHGAVAIETRVECTGPTGVEMEALTGATAAALTVYDMCKAVDKTMRIQNTHMVYKSGGRSGSFCAKAWHSYIGGPEGLRQRGLEPTPTLDESNGH